MKRRRNADIARCERSIASARRASGWREDVATLLPVVLELQPRLSEVAAELRREWLPSAILSPPSADAGSSPNDDQAPTASR